MNDPRGPIYRDFHAEQLTREEQMTYHSAGRVLDLLFDYISPKSVLDVGCGIGAWLGVFERRGITDLQGIEGPWLEPSNLRIDPARVQIRDLDRPFDLGRRFGLVTCIEVAEHLPESATAGFIESLTRHAPLVLFSAAIPGQGGTHHVNEQFPPYWAAHFGRFGYRLIDMLRPRLWDDSSIFTFLRQNLFLYANGDVLAENPRLQAEADLPRPMVSVVLPDQWTLLSQQFTGLSQYHANFKAQFESGGLFRVERTGEGELRVTRPGPIRTALMNLVFWRS